MKNNYEQVYRIKLTRRTPVIIRLDGKAFHTLTRKCKKPFDSIFQRTMMETALFICDEIQGAKCAYIQSDEISMLLTDFDTLATDAWFDYNLQKITSVSAGMASSHFSKAWGGQGIFDSRAFNIPKEEVCNYFVWRQQDWQRNSIQMYARAHYSHKQLHKKSSADIHEMLHEKGCNWADLEPLWKNGAFVWRNNKESNDKWCSHTIVFKDNRESIDQYMKPLGIEEGTSYEFGI